MPTNLTELAIHTKISILYLMRGVILRNLHEQTNWRLVIVPLALDLHPRHE